MKDDIERVLLTREQIAERVAQLGEEIGRDLEALADHPNEIVLVPILTGSIVFLADLMRHLPLKLRIDVVLVRSYDGQTTEGRDLAFRSEIPSKLHGRHVVIIDDILDTGRTLAVIQRIIREQQPATLKTCVLMRKQLDITDRPDADYVGFDVPNEFVVGYGLDYDDYYRNLPDIVVLHQQVIAQ